jgi:hypothetical protein
LSTQFHDLGKFLCPSERNHWSNDWLTTIFKEWAPILSVCDRVSIDFIRIWKETNSIVAVMENPRRDSLLVVTLLSPGRAQWFALKPVRKLSAIYRRGHVQLLDMGMIFALDVETKPSQWIRVLSFRTMMTQVRTILPFLQESVTLPWRKWKFSRKLGAESNRIGIFPRSFFSWLQHRKSAMWKRYLVQLFWDDHPSRKSALKFVVYPHFINDSLDQACKFVCLWRLLSVCLRSKSIRATVCYRPAFEWCSHGTWWWASTEISRMQIDDSKLFCPITPVFLEWDRRPLETLAMITIGTKRGGRRYNKKTLVGLYV